MADTLEDRVSRLERELANVKEKVETIDQDMQTLPGLITTQFRFVDSRLSRVLAEMADMRTHIDDKFDAVMRAVAEIVARKGNQD